jgi:hypothetical protein
MWRKVMDPRVRIWREKHGLTPEPPERRRTERRDAFAGTPELIDDKNSKNENM